MPLLLLLLIVAHFGLCMAALALRQRLGLAPLMIVVGALEGIKVYALTATLVELPGLGTVRLGSVVSYMNALAVVQVVYLRCGLGAARQLAWSVLWVAIAMGLLNQLIAAILQQPEVLPPLPVRAEQLAGSMRIEVVGNLLLLAGLLGSVVLVNAMQRIGISSWLSLLISLLLVSWLDTLLFLRLAFGADALAAATLLPALAGKSAAALLLASMGALYLATGRQDVAARQRPGGLALLKALSFRGRWAEMEQQLQTDPLTGLFNRRYLDHTVPELLHMDRLRGMPTSLLLVDLDHFKSINDRFGHLVGDQALRHAAKRLVACVRRNDVVLRYGGEEFLVLLPCTNAEEAERLGQQMLEELRRDPLRLDTGETLALSATIGLASSPTDGLQVNLLLQVADERLYAGKRAGRDRLVAA